MLLPPPGQRLILIVPRGELVDRSLPAALERITRHGWILAAIMDPGDHLAALRMIVDGLADFVLATRPEHMPSLRFAYDLGSAGPSRLVSPGPEQELPQPAGQDRHRRPLPFRDVDGQPVDRRPHPDRPRYGAARRPQATENADGPMAPGPRSSQLIRRLA